VSRRSRSLALLGMAAVCAGLSSSIVGGYARDVRAQVGPLTSVLVARTQIPRGRPLTAANVSRYLTVRQIPARFIPPRALRFRADAVGLRSLVPIAAGSYLSAAELASPAGREDASQPNRLHGWRVVEVTVAGAAAFQSALRPGARVDVLITSERGPGAPRTYLALQRIELADFRPAAEGEASTGENRESLAWLRVTLQQAVLLTAAQNFARELRLVPRVSNEVRRYPPSTVSARDLHP
jgi:pilus assembly protein CpaB